MTANPSAPIVIEVPLPTKLSIPETVAEVQRWFEQCATSSRLIPDFRTASKLIRPSPSEPIVIDVSKPALALNRWNSVVVGAAVEARVEQCASFRVSAVAA